MILKHEQHEGFQPQMALGEVNPALGSGAGEVLGARDQVLLGAKSWIHQVGEPARERLEIQASQEAQRYAAQQGESPYTHTPVSPEVERHATKLGNSAFTTVAAEELTNEAHTAVKDARQYDAPLAPELRTDPIEPVLTETEQLTAEAMRLVEAARTSTDDQYAIVG